MTQEDKELLLKDLCARLPYKIRVNYKEDDNDIHHWYISTLYTPEYSKNGILINSDHDGWIDYKEYKGCGMSSASRPLHLDKVLPYLRHLSSMTKEERKEFDKYGSLEYSPQFEIQEIADTIDWLNAHHFDYRGLIDKGLALEALEGIYDQQN